ncbi:MAG: DUF2461 domain-containing protein [Acidimicrobiales bacterium]|nr:DUF2461 domain-containing protein [Acidimicrobiales bacterium]
MARYFTADLFSFLNELKDNNTRQWFGDNKDRYEKLIRQPALQFIEDFREPLHSISPHFEANAKTVGGSLFRIHNDVRFSKDKTPYKTHVGIHFRHERAKDAHSPGFYVHLEPGNCFTGAGLWRPETKLAYEIRHYIADHPDQWAKIMGRKAFADRFELQGDSLKRPPKGFDAEHPLVDDLKRKDFIAISKFTQREVTSASFLDKLHERLAVSGDFMKYMCEAVGVPA